MQAGAGNDIGDQLFDAGQVFAQADHGLAHAGLLRQQMFDLAGLDAVAAQLELLVRPSQVVQRAVGAQPRQVAAAVQAAAGGAKGIGDETLGAQRRPAQIAAGQPAASEIQLALDARRQRSQGVVQHVDLDAGQRRADIGGLIVPHLAAHRRAHGGLGGAVGVQHGPAG